MENPKGCKAESLAEAPLGSRFEDALVYATRLHSAQFRKGTAIPYVAHLLGVANIVPEYGGNEDEAIAALLHDAIEDQGGQATRDEIGRRFGAHIAGIVKECSDTDVFRKPPWRARKETYVASLPRATNPALLVSAADELENARAILPDYRAIGESLWLRFNGGKEGTLWYYRQLVEIYRSTGRVNEALIEELDRVVSKSNGRRDPGRLRRRYSWSDQSLVRLDRARLDSCSGLGLHTRS
jgi:GTP pyrophosphokinase